MVSWGRGPCHNQIRRKIPPRKEGWPLADRNSWLANSSADMGVYYNLAFVILAFKTPRGGIVEEDFFKKELFKAKQIVRS